MDLFGILLQGFEKMVSGMYLGELVRRVILRMAEESEIFGPVSSKLLMPFVLRYVLPILELNLSLYIFCISIIYIYVYIYC